MRRPSRSIGSALGLLAVIVSALFLAGCGSGGTGNTIALPVITLSPASAAVAAGAQLQFTVTIVSPTTTTVTWSVNNILGGNSTLGTISTTGLYIAPATVPSPATVTIKATSPAETNPFGSSIVTVTAPAVNASVTIGPTSASTPTGTNIQFTATVTGTDNTAVTWYVNGVAGGNATVGTISSSGSYTAPSAAPSPATVVVTATSQADTSQSASTPVTLTTNNTAPLYVNFGPNGNSGSPDTASYNGLFTTVIVCLPATQQCQAIPNILVDTATVGLRVLDSALTVVPSKELGTVSNSDGFQVQECTQFPNTSYTWGTVLIADVVISGERASDVPIQVINDTALPVPSSGCLPLGAGPNLNTVAALGANGILGVGIRAQDCGLDCAAGQTFTGYPYYVCPHGVCQMVPVPLPQQVSNPIAFFPKDNNGVEIVLPSISAAGAPSLPFVNGDGTGLIPAGQLIFGVGTESNNALPSGATLYALDSNGNFPAVIYNGVTYNSGGSLHSAANALYLASPLTLNTSICADNSYYCPGSPATVSLILNGANGTSGTVALNVASADMLFAGSPGYAAFNDLARPSIPGLGSDSFDLGLPFFFGHSVFVGIAGTTVPGGASAPDGYFAF